MLVKVPEWVAILVAAKRNSRQKRVLKKLLERRGWKCISGD